MVKDLLFNNAPANFPDSYEELKAGVYQKIFAEWELEKPVEERNFYQLFNILCSNSRKPFREIEAKPENDEAIYLLTRWVVEQPSTLSKDLPATFTLDGRTITIPSKVGHLSIGQNIMLKQLLSKSKYLEQCLTMAVAIYIQPLFDNAKFSFTRAKELDALICEKSIVEVFPIGFFLLIHAMKYGVQPLNGWQQILNSLRLKLKIMSLSWPMSKGLQGMQIYQ